MSNNPDCLQTLHHKAHVEDIVENWQSYVLALKVHLKQAEDNIKRIQSSCQHFWVKWSIPHSAGKKCKKCQLINATCGSICYTPGNCQHDPLLIEEDVAKVGDVYRFIY